MAFGFGTRWALRTSRPGRAPVRELRERLRRLLCAIWGHDEAREERGAPVTEFSICRRCGRWWR